MVDFVSFHLTISTASPCLNFSSLFSSNSSNRDIVWKNLQNFLNLLSSFKTKKNTSSHSSRGASQPRSGNFCNSKLAIRGEAIRDSRARVISKKKKKIPATALAQRSKASNLFNAATIRACFIDVHAIDSELPLHSEWFGHEETNHAPSNKKLSRHSGSWKTMRYRAFM